jgi:rRNA-processing protein FCF1
MAPAIIFDSSALMIPFQLHVDFDRELKRLLGSYTGVVLTPVIKELDTLSEFGRGKIKLYAKAALDYIKQKRFKIVEAQGEADDAIFEFALKSNAITLTLDKELCKRLKIENRKAIGLGKGKALKFEACQT